jgi:outer membrane receptor protein involved in Fe transport
MRKSRFLTTTAAATLSLAGLSVGPLSVAYAQEAAADSNDDVVVVTATRRAGLVQDIPLNIAAVGTAQIEEQGFTELADVLAYVPGINVVDRGGRQGNPIVVRGLNADPLGSGDGNNDGGGTVATYIGEIPVYIDFKLNDMDRVEVLLGPQGTLYGAGTLGGAIRYIPNRPSFTANTLSVRGETFQYSEAESLSTEYGLTFNTALSDQFALRGSLDISNDTGFIDYPFVVRQIGVSEPDPNFSNASQVAANLVRVEDADSEDTVSGRLAARWQPTPWLDGTLTYYYQDQDIGGRRVSSARSTVPAGRYEAGLRVREPNQITNELLALEVVADLGFAELTSASGYSRYSSEGQRDQTDLLISLEYSYESFPTFTAFTREQDEEERFNQEIRLVSKGEGPFGWLAGVFYNELDTVGSSAEYVPGYAAFAGFNRPDNLEYFSQGRTNLVERAVFGEISYDITDQLTVTLGGRYYDYELKEYSAVDFPLFSPSFVAPSLDTIRDRPFDPTLGQSDDGFLSKINIAYEFTDDILVYATVSEGYRIGNSNGVAQCAIYNPAAPVVQGACALAPGQVYAPGGPGNVSTRDERQYTADTTTNYELGIKSAWLGGNLILNGAVYFIEWSDPQVSSATVNASIPITVNADGAESKGFEISGRWNATDNLSFRGNFSYTKSELTAPAPALVRTITPPGFGTAFEDGQSGDRLPGSPETQFSVFASYEQPLDNATLRYNFGYSWQGDVLTRTGARGGSLTLDSYGIANTSVTYDAGNWSGTFFVNNLFDEYAETGARATSRENQTINGANVRSFYTYVAAPRTIGIRLTRDFGG